MVQVTGQAATPTALEPAPAASDAALVNSSEAAPLNSSEATPVSSPELAPTNSSGETSSDGGACLCVFDVDRTLTGKQGETSECTANRVLDMQDDAYGGGQATLSALSVGGISATFCNDCYLGITSAGAGSGAESAWNRYMMDEIMRGAVHDEFRRQHPDAQKWSFGTDVDSPYVLNQGNKVKQDAVELVRQWYGRHGVQIVPGEVYFFDDRTENIMPFEEKGLNSREISCGSRDPELDGGDGMVGFCGARPEEVQRVKGNHLCE